MSGESLGEGMVIITVRLPRQLVEELDELVLRGVFPSRSAAIRAALREKIEKMNARGGGNAK